MRSGGAKIPIMRTIGCRRFRMFSHLPVAGPSRQLWHACLLLALFVSGFLEPVKASSRIKDLTLLEGGRDNQLVGYGLVVGLAGDGDSQRSIYTIASIANMLKRFGINLPVDDLETRNLRAKNVAAVIVTVDIPTLIKPGMRLDAVVSSIGDARSLQGGTLLQTPLLGADDEVYAVAQGSVLVGGFSIGDNQASVTRNHPTAGTVNGGAIVEREIRTRIVTEGSFGLLLRDPDYISAVRMAEAINQYFPASARAQTARWASIWTRIRCSGGAIIMSRR